ncbi:LacI family DNA-binding transcriptional regulator [Metabacillus malikii]|uniref:DNA-binding LacI/PurR family transcriptional regulator n=1 Tax=Metabacillus malikii TaxID=1504265 RepID=A0ABT9ZLZ7_9BACI|nr:LacI family DNA-binding transcriptional regulator [Metabacillus malikii]MDQ0232220.1 DNA-binding LacI/PurR family transcriptional regulator [Metabacillus malikii]
MSTIEDVAKLAGLSRTTVSRVLNNHPYVSEEKRKLVIEAMEHLGYVPNSSARSLRNRKTGIIAVLIPKISTPFFSQLIERLEIAASEKNYQLIICQTQYSDKKERTYLDLLKTKQVDGVIMTSCENDWKIIDAHLDYGPIVLCNEIIENVEVPMVFMNQMKSGYTIAKHLIESGHRKIAYCTNGTDKVTLQARETGFKRALAEAGLSIHREDYFQHVSSISDGKNIFHQLYHNCNSPTAIFTGSDSVAAGIISEAKRHGWVIPQDLAVVGFDNMEITELMDPMITTVIQPVETMAAKAIDVIVDKIHKKQYRSRETHEFTATLAIRESTLVNSKLVATS